MSELPADLESHVDHAMREIGFAVASQQPWFNRKQKDPPDGIFFKEYDFGGFKYLMTVTGSDIARNGVEAVIAMNVRTAANALRFKTAQSL